MNRWAKAAIIGLVVFVVVAAALFFVSRYAAIHSVIWQAAGQELTTHQKLLIWVSLAMRRAYTLVVPILFVSILGTSFLVAALTGRRLR